MVEIGLKRLEKWCIKHYELLIIFVDKEGEQTDETSQEDGDQEEGCYRQESSGRIEVKFIVNIFLEMDGKLDIVDRNRLR